MEENYLRINIGLTFNEALVHEMESGLINGERSK